MKNSVRHWTGPSEHRGQELVYTRRSYEAEIELSELTLPLVEELELLAPFGEGNPEPLFRTDWHAAAGTQAHRQQPAII